MPQSKTPSIESFVDGANNQSLKVSASVICCVYCVRNALIKELLFGASIVDMVVMHSNIKSGSKLINTAHMAASISVSNKRISIDSQSIFLIIFTAFIEFLMILLYFLSFSCLLYVYLDFLKLF
jgi:hypothetical protein